MNPAFESTLTLTISGAEGYYHYDFQRIAVPADGVKDYSFSWTVPDAVGMYVVEVGLVPAQLTAYEAAWLDSGWSWHLLACDLRNLCSLRNRVMHVGL